MKVGDYVRTNDRGVRKVGEIIDNLFYRDEEGNLHQKGNLIKSSPNIIDLIEEDDYVNGMRMTEIISNKNGVLKCMADSDYECITTITNNEIESVLTKEQFKEIEYVLDKGE